MPVWTPRHWAPTPCSTISLTCRARSSSSVSLREPQVGAAPPQFGEFGGEPAELAGEFEAYRDHQIAGQRPREPQYPLIGRLVAAVLGREAGNPIPRHPADLSCVAGARQGPRRRIGKAQIIMAAAIE